MYRHSVPLPKGERGGGNTVYTHSGTLSKGQRGGGTQCTHIQDLYLKVREVVEDSVLTLGTSI